ncbi:hypothetical protein D3C77_481950 [compost metagenome]
MTEWSGYYHYFASWVADFKPKLDQVIYYESNQYAPISVENGTYMLISSVSGSDLGYAGLLMNEMLLGTRNGSYQIGSTKEDIRLPLRSLMWYVYYKEVEGYSHEDMMDGRAGYRMLNELVHSDPDRDPDKLSLRMAKQVDQALEAGKSEEVKEVLNYFYDQGLEVPIEASTAPVKVSPIPFEAWEREWEKVMGHENGA